MPYLHTGVTKGFKFLMFKLHVGQGHTRSLVLKPVDRPHSDFLFVYVGMLSNKSGSST